MNDKVKWISIGLTVLTLGGGLVANAAVSYYKANSALEKVDEVDARLTKIETFVAEYFGRLDERTDHMKESLDRIEDQLKEIRNERP